MDQARDDPVRTYTPNSMLLVDDMRVENAVGTFSDHIANVQRVGCDFVHMHMPQQVPSPLKWKIPEILRDSHPRGKPGIPYMVYAVGCFTIWIRHRSQAPRRSEARLARTRYRSTRMSNHAQVHLYLRGYRYMLVGGFSHKGSLFAALVPLELVMHGELEMAPTRDADRCRVAC